MISSTKIKRLEIANLRYFNPIGAHSSGLIGENPTGRANNIFPIFLDVAVRKKQILKFLGMNGLLLMEQELRYTYCGFSRRTFKDP